MSPSRTTPLAQAQSSIQAVDTSYLTAAGRQALDIASSTIAGLLSSTHPVSAADVAAAADAAEATLSSLVSVEPFFAVFESFIALGLAPEDFTPTSAERLMLELTALVDMISPLMSDPTAVATQADIDAAAARLAKAFADAVLLTDSGITITHGDSTLADGAALTAGDTITVTSKALEPGSIFRVELHSTPIELGRMTVGADGIGHLTVTLPTTVSGQHTLHTFWVERGASDATDTTLAVNITAAPAPAPEPTPDPAPVAVSAVDRLVTTGGTLAGLTPALALLGLGAALLAVTRGRRDSAASSPAEER